MANKILYVLYRYVGNQRQFWDENRGWNLESASLMDVDEKDDFIKENPNAFYADI